LNLQELKIPMMKVAATELVAGLSGESEERIREVFENAKNSAPIVLFLDEIDAIAPHRANAQREMERRIVAQLLVSMDGSLKILKSKTWL
jgi:ribosome biogenesis ATPase